MKYTKILNDVIFLITGNVSSKFLQLELRMQHASFLYRKRTLGGLRTTIETVATGSPISSIEVAWFDYTFFVKNMFKQTTYRNFIYRLLGIPQPRTLYFLVEAKSRVREVYTQTCLHFAKQGMLDTELFGLAVLIGT